MMKYVIRVGWLSLATIIIVSVYAYSFGYLSSDVTYTLTNQGFNNLFIFFFGTGTIYGGLTVFGIIKWMDRKKKL